MVLIDLYFGRDVAGRAPVSEAEWAGFARAQITPRFADGFTVIDARGQWLNPASRTMGIETTKMVRIAAAADATLTSRVNEVIEAYREQFHQQAVGVTSQEICGAF